MCILGSSRGPLARAHLHLHPLLPSLLSGSYGPPLGPSRARDASTSKVCQRQRARHVRAFWSLPSSSPPVSPPPDQECTQRRVLRLPFNLLSIPVVQPSGTLIPTVAISPESQPPIGSPDDTTCSLSCLSSDSRVYFTPCTSHYFSYSYSYYQSPSVSSRLP